jgi:hypothetical protein
MKKRFFRNIGFVCSFFMVAMPFCGMAEPIVILGSMVPSFLGKPIEHLRCLDHQGKAIPFQIDEVLPDDDYVCSGGKEPNNGNGILDTSDEIVFLWEDADTLDSLSANSGDSQLPSMGISPLRKRITIGHATQTRYVYLVDDSSVALSPVRYISFNDTNGTVETPYFHATFERNRFHFVKAGVKDFTKNTYFDMTNELRVKIRFHALWGLVPLSYDEEDIFCSVKRYKVGPIRLIRRGDFYLKLGLWIKGSHAAVNQLCYPDMVKVPVYVHLPMHFSTLFSQAYIEMTPVLNEASDKFSFRVPQYDIAFQCGKKERVDTLVPINPNHGFMTVENGAIGYGWLLEADMAPAYLDESGFVFCKPTNRKGICHCGFRLSVCDLPKGRYSITNWVVFSHNGAAAFALDNAAECLKTMASISIEPTIGGYVNQLKKVMKFKKW